MARHHFYLPQLSDENIPVPKQFAHWSNNDKKIFLGVSDGILIDENARTKEVSSIPDIWARPLLFQSATRRGTKHPLHNRSLQEWRGLLSLLALQKVIPQLAPLHISPVSLDDERFSVALRNLCPRPVQLEENVFYNWTDLLLIKFGKVPIGGFSPSTLVFTATDYRSELAKTSFPKNFLDENGYISYPQRKEDGLEYIGEWLYFLKERLNKRFYSADKNPDFLVIGNLNGLMSDWLTEIRTTLNLKEDDQIDARKYKTSDEPVDINPPAPFLKNYSVYQQLLYPLVKDNSKVEEASSSEVSLISPRNHGKYKEVVIITEKILSEDVILWDEIRPTALGDDPQKILQTHFNQPFGTKIGMVDIGEKGGCWIRPDLFFITNSLLKGREDEFLTGAESYLNLGTKYVLPFRKELLNYFSPQDIRELLKPVLKEDSGIVRFSFSLPIRNGQQLKIERTFRTKGANKGEGEIVDTDVPVVEIFPNYLGSNWRRYFLFQNASSKFKVNPFILNPNATIKKKVHEIKYEEQNDSITISQINGDQCFPEALEIVSEKNSPIGLIMLSKESKEQGLKNKWTIGVDFGTSNTNVYKNRGTADTAEKWSYNFPEYYRRITSTKDSKRNVLLRDYFFPTEEIKLPIPSTLKIYNLAERNNNLLDYFIFFPDPNEYQFPDTVLSDIKWDGEGERKTEYFLESLIFLLLIEVVQQNVGEVNIACSYPKAFSETNINIFKREWETVFDKLLKPEIETRILNIHSGTSTDNELKSIIHKPVFKTEGIAAGEYFASELTIPNIEERANKEIAAICLDVGGGTTDISIWYLNNIEFDASVILAGRQISNILQRNGRIRELLFTKPAAVALEEKKSEPAYFSARLNLILKYEEERIQEMLIKQANQKDIQWLRQILALEFGALAYYAAMVCVSTDEKVGGLLQRIENAGINLHWGGNAAKLINWIDFGKYNREGIASKVLNGVFFNCLNDKSLAEKAVKAKQVSQLQSPGHKSEAAGGLVVMNLENSNHHSDDDGYSMVSENLMPDDISSGSPLQFYAGVVSGENIELTDGRKINFQQSISDKDLFDENRTKFKSTTLEKFNKFIDILNYFGIKNGLFTEDTKIALKESERQIIRDGVLKEYIKMQSLKEGKRLIEPIFIIEIKLLLELLKSKLN